MKITIEIDDDSLFDMINEGASFNDKSVDRAKFDELVKWADFQQALTVKLEQVLYEDFEFMQDFAWLLYSEVAKFDMFTSYDANEELKETTAVDKESMNAIFDKIQELSEAKLELSNTKCELERARTEILELKRAIREYQSLIEEHRYQEMRRAKETTKVDLSKFADMDDPELVRNTIVELYFDGLTGDEIAEQLGISYDTVDTVLAIKGL